MSLKRNVIEALMRGVGYFSSQAELARQIGASEGTLSRWLRGQMAPSFQRRLRIAQALKLDVESFELPADAFRVELDRALPVAPSERAGVTITEKHSPLWPSAWPLIRGYHKLLYTQPDGRIEISEIVFIALHREGVLTRLFNWDTEKAAREKLWEYEGYVHIIDGYGYASLAERKGLNELAFMIFRMPTGTDNENIHGHLLVRSIKGSFQRSAVKPCILIKTEGQLAPGTYGTFDARALYDAGLLDDEVVEHLTDMPTANLADIFGRSSVRRPIG